MISEEDFAKLKPPAPKIENQSLPPPPPPPPPSLIEPSTLDKAMAATADKVCYPTVSYFHDNSKTFIFFSITVKISSKNFMISSKTYEISSESSGPDGNRSKIKGKKAEVRTPHRKDPQTAPRF